MSIKHNLDTSVFETETTTIANPAAATDFTFTVPANTRMLIVSISFTLTTDANVANRTIRLIFSSPTVAILSVSSQTAQAASESGQMSFYIGAGESFSSFYSLDKHIPLPDHYWLNPGSSVSSNIRSFQAGDTITNIRIHHLTQIME